ncbi:uncharacterized protein B0T15DRAFT_522801 [Chaetomium strumarium]|uniref:Uncharacterized protein n=1 Tax=Chaetomium strumarium TaxID=1170767 RepID=A0AAJ0GXA5_9PEZI|nr:hypothetical protein B0T15DRAFT_522801 [Chaetomium strumarium]
MACMARLVGSVMAMAPLVLQSLRDKRLAKSRAAKLVYLRCVTLPRYRVPNGRPGTRLAQASGRSLSHNRGGAMDRQGTLPERWSRSGRKFPP